jgi:hypothetical protein
MHFAASGLFFVASLRLFPLLLLKIAKIVRNIFPCHSSETNLPNLDNPDLIFYNGSRSGASAHR